MLHRSIYFCGYIWYNYDEFRNFIGKDIKLDPIILNKESGVSSILDFFMGKNTPERQSYIIENLRYEEVQ